MPTLLLPLPLMIDLKGRIETVRGVVLSELLLLSMFNPAVCSIQSSPIWFEMTGVSDRQQPAWDFWTGRDALT